ncbi:serine hydrolase [Pontibacter sp. HSC-36F09]|uniref:serine hydrolase domain-containing protein n=1 Tax=Pontibacter sp. HSC-36F09 TaxID=2910966 RepID=UPI00209EAEEE|nr:serine hydrolase domain-containing protein [Pontibacter sp. HSC-36F09]MCP2044425.1 CubicO group peptidase (beta-lactamase class C family) [Pontibacter sp. HSC-36F09]
MSETGFFPFSGFPDNTSQRMTAVASTTGGSMYLSPAISDISSNNVLGSDPKNSGAQRSIYYNVEDADGSVVQRQAIPGSAYIHFDETLDEIMRRYDVPGLAISITRNGEPVFVRSYGYADKEKEELVSDQSLFRIASLSKPITSAGILKLIQDGKLTLADKVFGAEGILADDFPEPADPNITQITINHLLTHTSGWPNSKRDPMLVDGAVTAREIITEQVQHQVLEHQPGSTVTYSNLGYSILGRVIEKVTGKPYQNFVQEEILHPAKVFGMQIAGDSAAEQAPKEVKYYQREHNPYSYNMARMDAHGGWLSSTGDLMRFMALIDRNPAIPDLIGENLLQTTYFGGDTWTHYGSLPGTTTVLSRVNDEYSFVVLANTRYNRSPNRIADEITDALREKILSMESWPTGVEQLATND